MTDAGYQGAAKRPDAKVSVNWYVAMRPGKRRALDEDQPGDALIGQLEKLKAGIRAKVEHPFRVIKRQFGYTPVRLQQGALQGIEEEHGPAHHAVCPVQSVDGQAPTDGATGMSAPGNRQNGPNKTNNAKSSVENRIA